MGDIHRTLVSQANEIDRLIAERRDVFFAGCDFGSKYAGDQFLGTPERQRGFEEWKRNGP